jgi:cell division protein FtsI (penicillin-binding protein 3)
VVVMEVATGEIRALANLTRYPGQTPEADQYLETYNHAVATRTDPGSTFKLVSMMALLEEKAVWPGKTVNTGNGKLAYQPVRGRIINIIDPKRNGYGTLTAQQVLEKSSNIGIHLLMKDYFYKKPDLYCQYLRQFRLTLPTNVGMKGEPIPFIKTPDAKAWDKYGSLTYMSYGYEMLITPLQMLTFYNAVANDGKWVKPMLVKQLAVGGKATQEFTPVVLPKPIASIGTIRKVKSMLEGVVHHGTGKAAGSPFYQVAGKTGTAQKNIGGHFEEGSYYSSFIGYFPAKKPKYSMIVGIDNPQFTETDSLYGGKVAAPIFRVVADRIHAYDARMHPPLPTNRVTSKPILRAGYAEDLHQISTELGVTNQPTAEGWVRLTDGGNWKPQANKPGQVPDVRGLPLRDALFLLENRGLRVSASGRGRVAKQSLNPGTAASMGRQVLLTLE